MRAVLLIAWKDLRQRLRDRSFFIYGVAAPLALAYVFSLLLGPLARGVPDPPTIGLVDGDRSAVSAGMRSLLGAVQDAGVITWREVEPAAGAPAPAYVSSAATDGLAGDARLEPVLSVYPDPASAIEGEAYRELAARELDAAIVVPVGLLEALGREPATVRVLGTTNTLFGTQLAETLVDSFLARLRAGAWTVAALSERGGVVLAPLVMAQVASAPQPLVLVDRRTSERQLDLVTYMAAGMAVFFVFFIVQMGVAGLLDEERDGTMARLMAAPIGRRAIVGGKVLASVCIGVLSLLVLWGASTLLMGARWGEPVAVLLLILAVVAAAAGVLMAVAAFARSAEAAGNVQSIVAITLGVLGGTFFPLPEAGGALSLLMRVSPHFWFLRGMADAAGGGVAAALPDVLAILAFAAVAGGLGWAAFGRRLTR